MAGYTSVLTIGSVCLVGCLGAALLVAYLRGAEDETPQVRAWLEEHGLTRYVPLFDELGKSLYSLFTSACCQSRGYVYIETVC
jgi:hypothetical protein